MAIPDNPNFPQLGQHMQACLHALIEKPLLLVSDGIEELTAEVMSPIDDVRFSAKWEQDRAEQDVFRRATSPAGKVKQ